MHFDKQLLHYVMEINGMQKHIQNPVIHVRMSVSRRWYSSGKHSIVDVKGSEYGAPSVEPVRSLYFNTKYIDINEQHVFNTPYTDNWLNWWSYWGKNYTHASSYNVQNEYTFNLQINLIWTTSWIHAFLIRRRLPVLQMLEISLWFRQYFYYLLVLYFF